jgi:hypothetical protein
MRDRSMRRGNYTILMGFTVLGVIGFGAMGVDISYIAMANSQAQAVADAASHAALMAYRSSDGETHDEKFKDAEVAAAWIVQNNDIGLSGPGELRSLKFGTFNARKETFTPGVEPPNAFRADVTRPGDGLALLIAPLLGFHHVEVEQMGTTASAPREIMLTIDLSCSMYQGIGTPNRPTEKGYVAPDGVWYATAHEATRDAMVAFGEYMVENQVPRDRLGATVFAERAENWMPARYVDAYGDEILRSWADWGVPNMNPGKLWQGDSLAVAFQSGRYWYYGTKGSLARGLARGSNKVQDCQDVAEVMFRWEGWNKYPDRPNLCDIGTCTNPGPAVWDAIDELTTVNSDPLAFKAIIIISDGMPTCGDSSAGLLKATQAAWDRDIHVWTVAYDGTDGIDASLMTKAAKGMGRYYETPNQDRLADIMVEIAKSIPVSIVE